MNRAEKRALAAFYLKEAAKPEGINSVETLRQLAMSSKDHRARISAIRSLAAEVAAHVPRTTSSTALWSVKAIPPSSKEWVDRAKKDDPGRKEKTT